MTTTLPITDIALASSQDDAGAVAAVVQHHAQLAARLEALVGGMLSAAAAGGERFADARQRASAFCRDELVPHAAAEEEALYPTAAAHDRGRLLVDGMLAEHRVITQLVDELAGGADPVRAAAASYALLVLFEAHLAKENDLVLPLLAADPAVSLAGILDGMHELLGGEEHSVDEAPAAESGHGSCGCGDSDHGVPELDVRSVPHAIRHATVFGAFDAIPSGGSLLLVAPHDPLPLLRQLADRAGGALAVDYEQRGPDGWRLLLTRT